MSDKIEALRQTPILADLSEDTLASLALSANATRVASGEDVFTEGAPGNSVYFIRSGEVRIRVEGPTGTDITLATLGPPDAFGTLALLDGRPRSATATVTEDAELIVLYRDDFLAVLEHEFSAVKTILRALTAIVRRMNERLADVAMLGMSDRVAKAIAFFMERYGTELDDGTIRIDHPMTYEDVASQAGLYASAVERIMANLQYDNVIEREPETWLIHRPQRFSEHPAEG